MPREFARRLRRPRLRLCGDNEGQHQNGENEAFHGFSFGPRLGHWSIFRESTASRDGTAVCSTRNAAGLDRSGG